MPFFFYLQVGCNSSQLAMLIKNYCNFLTRNYAQALGRARLLFIESTFAAAQLRKFH